jgi:hypothetical protein
LLLRIQNKKANLEYSVVGCYKNKYRSGVVGHACNPSTQRLRQEDYKFKVSLGYMVRLSQKQTIKQTQKPKQQKLKKNVAIIFIGENKRLNSQSIPEPNDKEQCKRCHNT